MLIFLFFLVVGRFYTFEEAHRIDSRSNGRGVRQFKNSLLRRLEKASHLRVENVTLILASFLIFFKI